MSTLTLLLTLALAPQPAAADDPADADAAAYKGNDGDVSVYEFADDKLTGDHLSPDGKLIQWRRPARHPSLIHLRGHFNAELVKLALDL
ncbi:hypothetical protein [Paraliomyxa miuraensis]|uniref:hypothetical protein n=1 Tax=Paraliomyxa miuraensis TaxID=376150 RepID=UPI0022538B0E|nr:hypothetical protein [Paraliomyxa miuraensis]MCX4242758.1 hypothetical protein [Paraliomyxa miuraensis]